MQVAADIFKVLIFPGLLFMAISGSLMLLLEGGVSSLLYGGENRAFLKARSRSATKFPPLSRLAIVMVSLISLGAAGALLVSMKGNIFNVILLLSAAELIPLFFWPETSQRQAAHLPLAVKAALIRMMTLFLVAVSVSLRSRGSFLADLDSFKQSGSFKMLTAWGGFRYGLILAALISGVLALLVFDLGSPVYAYVFEGEKVSGPQGAYLLLGRGAERAIIILLLILIFIGYPWVGWMGIAAWSGTAFGAALALAVLRGWAEGKDRASLRKWRYIGLLLASVSLAAALAASW